MKAASFKSASPLRHVIDLFGIPFSIGIQGYVNLGSGY